MEIDEVAVTEETEENDRVETGVVGQRAKGRAGPETRGAFRMEYPPLHYEHGDD